MRIVNGHVEDGPGYGQHAEWVLLPDGWHRVKEGTAVWLPREDHGDRDVSTDEIMFHFKTVHPVIDGGPFSDDDWVTMECPFSSVLAVI